MNEKVKQTLNGILECFRINKIPEAVALSMFPIPDIPSARWSLMNRTIMYLSGTQDGRGFRQWQQVDRYVKKGSKAFYILVPFIKKEKKDDGEERQILLGFSCKPVFRVEDTDGDPLDYLQLELPELPLIEKAEQWGISVRAIPGNYQYYGSYSSKRREILLASPEEQIFFHELSHAGHEKVKGGLKNGDPFQEIVAELSATVLCKIVGKQANATLGSSYRYIEKYAEKVEMSAYSACMKVMADTEKVLNLILKGGKNEIHAR